MDAGAEAPKMMGRSYNVGKGRKDAMPPGSGIAAGGGAEGWREK